MICFTFRFHHGSGLRMSADALGPDLSRTFLTKVSKSNWKMKKMYTWKLFSRIFVHINHFIFIAEVRGAACCYWPLETMQPSSISWFEVMQELGCNTKRGRDLPPSTINFKACQAEEDIWDQGSPSDRRLQFCQVLSGPVMATTVKRPVLRATDTSSPLFQGCPFDVWWSTLNLHPA